MKGVLGLIRGLTGTTGPERIIVRESSLTRAIQVFGADDARDLRHRVFVLHDGDAVRELAAKADVPVDVARSAVEVVRDRGRRTDRRRFEQNDNGDFVEVKTALGFGDIKLHRRDVLAYVARLPAKEPVRNAAERVSVRIDGGRVALIDERIPRARAEGSIQRFDEAIYQARGGARDLPPEHERSRRDWIRAAHQELCHADLTRDVDALVRAESALAKAEAMRRAEDGWRSHVRPPSSRYTNLVKRAARVRRALVAQDGRFR